MEIKIKTNGYSETYNVYKLARGVFYHLDHDGIDINYEYSLDGESSVTITFSNFSWRETTKLDELVGLIKTFTPEVEL